MLRLLLDGREKKGKELRFLLGKQASHYPGTGGLQVPSQGVGENKGALSSQS